MHASLAFLVIGHAQQIFFGLASEEQITDRQWQGAV